MAGKQASEAPRASFFKEKPYDLLIRGVDDTDEDNLLNDKDKSRLELDPHLLASMRIHGVLRPVEACKRDEMSWVVDGRRRVVHARKIWDEQEAAGVPEDQRIHLKTIYVRGEDTFLFFRARAHNSGALEESPLARARDAQMMLARDMSEADIAATFCCDVQTVKGYLRLIEADDKVKRAVETGKIAASAGMQLAKLKTTEEQRIALDELLASGAKPTEREAKKKVNKVKSGEDKVGVSRRIIRELRDTVAEPGDDIDEKWQEGFVSALSIVLGDGAVDKTAKHWLREAQKKRDKKTKSKEKEKAE